MFSHDVQGGLYSQALPLLELSVRSLLPSAPTPQVRCSKGVSSDGDRFFLSTGNWIGNVCPRVKDLNHCVMLLLRMWYQSWKKKSLFPKFELIWIWHLWAICTIVQKKKIISILGTNKYIWNSKICHLHHVYARVIKV